jgi:hypothetical protein
MSLLLATLLRTELTGAYWLRKVTRASKVFREPKAYRENRDPRESKGHRATQGRGFRLVVLLGR